MISPYFLYSHRSEKGSQPITAERKSTMKNKFILDFHLFDGEGGMGDTGATASTQSDTKQDTEKKPQIEYGKSTGEGQTPSQVGSDNETASLNEEFAALIGKGGKFHDLYGQAVSAVIQDRFKNQANLQAQVDGIANDLSPLFMTYGLDTGDFEGLKEAIANDDTFFQAQAERAGLDVDQYKENLRLKAEAERGRRITEAYENEQRKQQAFAQWEAEADALKEAFPNFDLGLEIRNNEQFANLLDKGVDVQTAFAVTHLADIQNGSNAYATRTATQNLVNTIQSRASRPIENGMQHAPAIQRKSDPRSLTNEDIDEINRRVANGEAISF